MRRKKVTGRFLACLSLVLLFCLSFSVSSFATGDGSGGGAGAVVPLYMDWSYPADGASNVSVTPVIHCKFSHNVAQTNVSERNKTLVTLKDEDGREVDITVFMADSQIQFDKRQFIYVSPVKPLDYGTTYTLYLHEGIQAKNNMATDEVQTITFTTEYGRSSFNAPLVTPPVSNELTEEETETAGSAENGDASSGVSAGETESGEQNGDASGSGGGSASDGGSTTGDASGDSGDGTSGAASGDAASNSDSAPADSADAADSESSDGSADAAGAAGGSGGLRDLLNGLFSGGSGLAAAAAAVILAAAAGAGVTGIWIRKKNASADAFLSGLTERSASGRKQGAKRAGKPAAKHVSLILAGVLAVSSALPFFTEDSYAAVPDSFKVRILIGDTVVSEKDYTDEELRALEQTRQVYSGINEEGLPCVIAAEGVTLEALTAAQGVDFTEIESVSIYRSEEWQRNMIYNYLYGVDRYYYPHLAEAWLLENGEDTGSGEETAEEGNGGSSEDTGSGDESGEASAEGSGGDGSGAEASAEEADAESGSAGTVRAAAVTGTAGGTQTSGSGIDPEEYRYQDAVKVEPMLALRSSNSQLAEEPDWSSLSSLEGYRFCFGQMNPSDGSYLMYGYNLTAIDIKVTAAGEFAASVGMQDTTGKKVTVSGGADSPGSAEVEGPYENPLTGETIGELPDKLTIQVGYFGTEYYTVKEFTFEELASMPLVRQAYSAVSSDGTNGILTAMGVRLVDIITAAGVDVSSVEQLRFYNALDEEIGVTASRAWLIDMNRYYYPNLTSTLNYTTGGGGAARNAVRTDAILALKDYWDESSAVPDFYRLDGTHRYHLIYGQTSARSDNLSKSILWVDTIKLQLSGSPSEETWSEEYLGKLVGSGEGNGTGTGGGSGNGGSSSGSSAEPSAGEAVQSQEIPVVSDDANLEKINASGKHVYEISGGSVSWSFGSEEEENYAVYIGIVFGTVFLLGAGISYLAYRRRMAGGSTASGNAAGGMTGGRQRINTGI